MTPERRLLAELRRLRQEKVGLRQGVVSSVSPFKVKLGGSDVELLAFGMDGVSFSVGERVSVLVSGMGDLLVLGRNSSVPAEAGAGVYSAGAGLDLTGTVFSAEFGSGAGKVTEGNDSRLSDARTPTAHATSHKSGGSDELKLNELAVPSANVAMNTKKLTGLTQGTVAGDSAEYSQMVAGDVAAQMGFTLKSSVYAASIAALPAHSRSGSVLTASANGFLAPSFGELKFKWKSGTEGTGNGQFKQPCDVQVDGSGTIWVADKDNSRVQYFNSSGVYQGKFSTSYPPLGIALDSSGNIWTVEGTVILFNKLVKYSSSGTVLASTSLNGTYPQPVGGIAIDSSGYVFVSQKEDSGGVYSIKKYNSSAVYQSSFGSTGTGNGEFNNPRAIAIDSSDNIWVADTGNNRIQKFNSSGTYQSKFGSTGSGTGQFYGPTGIDIDSSGNIWVADQWNGRVQKFNSSGTYVSSVGSAGQGNGQFYGVCGIATTSGGDLIVADSLNNRIQRFDAFTLSANQSVLVRHEGSGSHVENSIYTVTNPGSGSTKWSLTLRDDMADGYVKNQNMVIAQLENGAENRVFTLNTPDPITVWTTALTWNRFEPGGPPSPHGSNHSPGAIDPIPELTELYEQMQVEGWHEIDATGEPAFSNSWVNYGAGYNTAAFFKDPNGVVHLKGLIKSGTVTSAVFTLPSGYRPAATEVQPIVSNGAAGYIDIQNNGVLKVVGGSSAWASLDGITFRAA